MTTLDVGAFGAALDAYGIDAVVDGLEAAITAYLAALSQPALAVKGLALGKLPAEFRVRAHGQWLHFEDEQMAQESAEMHGVDYQGLYVRDGTGCEIPLPLPLSRITKSDDGYLHEWVDADGEQHSYVHPTNLSLPAPDTALVASPPPSGEADALREAANIAFDEMFKVTGAPVARAVQQKILALAALSSAPATADGWREVDTDHMMKGRRRTPAYFPATGETCEVSGPNCDNADGYTWMPMTVLWQNDKFVLYGKEGCWPVLHKHEHVLFRPLPAAPTATGGR